MRLANMRGLLDKGEGEGEDLIGGCLEETRYNSQAISHVLQMSSYCLDRNASSFVMEPDVIDHCPYSQR